MRRVILDTNTEDPKQVKYVNLRRRLPHTFTLIGEQFQYFTLGSGEVIGTDFCYYRNRDEQPVVGFLHCEPDYHYMVDYVLERCTPEERREVELIINFHAGTYRTQ